MKLWLASSEGAAEDVDMGDGEAVEEAVEQEVVEGEAVEGEAAEGEAAEG